MRMEANLSLLFKYPLISCEMRDGNTYYDGIIAVQNKDYEIHVTEEMIDEELFFKLTGPLGGEILENGATINADNIVEFLDKLTAILEASSRQNPKNRVNLYRRILHEYSEFVKFHLNVRKSQLSADLSTILGTVFDEGGRKHSLEIWVDFDEIKDIYRLHNVDLPEQLCKDLTKKFGSLTEVFEKFLSIIEVLQPFFDVMDDLDRCCCVLDPEKPTRKDCYRRIWLDQNLSVVVTVDPSNVGMRPDLKFLGPERLVLRYREKLNEKLEEWDDETDLVQGLLNILGIEKFPSKPDTNQETLMETGECSICFSLRFNDKLPEIICSNKSCENFYHVSCLYEWLTSINSRRVFSEIRGQCPNCEKGISCPLPETENAVGPAM